MQRLVAKENHRRQRAETAAKQRDQQQYLFRHAPPTPLSTHFIAAIKNEGEKIDDKQTARRNEMNIARTHLLPDFSYPANIRTSNCSTQFLFHYNTTNFD